MILSGSYNNLAPPVGRLLCCFAELIFFLDANTPQSMGLCVAPLSIFLSLCLQICLQSPRLLLAGCFLLKLHQPVVKTLEKHANVEKEGAQEDPSKEMKDHLFVGIEHVQSCP